jgi:putative ABC transport system permease protein
MWGRNPKGEAPDPEPYNMLKNYLTAAVRNLLRHKAYSIINIAGLSVGMACTILILLGGQYELSYDRYHENADRIYRLGADIEIGEMRGRYAVSSMPIGPTLQRDYPEVLAAVRFYPHDRKLLAHYKDKKFLEDGIIYTEDSIFDVFTFPLVSGDPKTVLATADSLVITAAMARKYFGSENPIGKILKLEDKVDLKVTGVMQNVPLNSHFTFNMLLSWELLKQDSNYKHWEKQWIEHKFYTYLLLRNKQDAGQLEHKFAALIQSHMGKILEALDGRIEYFLQPLTGIHLHSDLGLEIEGNGDIVWVYAFSVIGIFILLTACINYMNLATARSINRTKEVGVRKALGANRSNLVYQFFGESVIFSFFSFLFAIGLVELSIPFFRTLIGSDIRFDFLNLPWLVPGSILLVLLVAVIAGCYPALFLSAFHPIRVLTGSFKAGTPNVNFRSLLVVIQYAISTSLVIVTCIVLNQLNYVTHKSLGFDKEHIVCLRARNSSIWRSFDATKSDLNGHSGITAVTAASRLPGQFFQLQVLMPEGTSFKQSQFFEYKSIDPDFIPALGIEISAGRNFSTEFSSDLTEAILINEAAARQFQWDNPIGRKITFIEDELITKTVIGVVKDFHLRSLHHMIQPLCLDYRPSSFRYVMVKIKPNRIPEVLQFLEKKWELLQPAFPFDYFFLDEAFGRQYKADEKIARIFTCFTVLAIFIACLGLFGLASFTAEKRTKELGIRKALGASVSEIIWLLSKEFTKWVLVANFIAWPLAYLAMNKWLQNFAYRINIGLGAFVLSAWLALLIALLTVGFQSIRAARANPVDALRYE